MSRRVHRFSRRRYRHMVRAFGQLFGQQLAPRGAYLGLGNQSQSQETASQASYSHPNRCRVTRFENYRENRSRRLHTPCVQPAAASGSAICADLYVTSRSRGHYYVAVFSTGVLR